MYKNILILAVLFGLIDSVYLTTTSSYYSQVVKNIQGKEITLKPIATILCYISLVLSLYIFIIRENKSILYAGLLGFFVYSVFELTNMAIFDNWEWKAVILDSSWGAILFMITTYIYNNIHNIQFYKL